VRRLSREDFAAEALATPELVDRVVEMGAIQPLDDGRFDARDQVIASTVMAMVDAGIQLDDLAWAIGSGRFGIQSLGRIFSEPAPRTEQTFAELAASLGASAALLPAVYAALGLPEPEPDDHLRVDEALPRGTASFEPIGRVELKGIARPVALWRASAPKRKR